MKRCCRIWLAIALLLLSGCRDRLVITRDGIGRESAVMIAEAAENTR